MARRGLPEINAGSMADIAFLLLIFFLVTTTMDVDSGISRKLPPMPEEQIETPEVHKRNIFVVLVNKNNKILAGQGVPTNKVEIDASGTYNIIENGIKKPLLDELKKFINNRRSISEFQYAPSEDKCATVVNGCWYGDLTKNDVFVSCDGLCGNETLIKELNKNKKQVRSIDDDGNISWQKSPFKGKVRYEYNYKLNPLADESSSDNPQKAIISLQNQEGTSYKVYIEVQNLLTQAYNEIRREYAIEKYGVEFSQLPNCDQEYIKKRYPMKISEAETKAN